jgi:hypothetical protein
MFINMMYDLFLVGFCNLMSARQEWNDANGKRVVVLIYNCDEDSDSDNDNQDDDHDDEDDVDDDHDDV